MTGSLYHPDEVRFVVNVKPVSTNATYRTGKGRFYKSDASRDYLAALRLAAMHTMRGRPRLEGPVCVEVTFGFDSRRPDLDGPIKGFLDALEGAVYANDRQVVALHAFKQLDKANPYVSVRVTRAEVLGLEPDPDEALEFTG